MLFAVCPLLLMSFIIVVYGENASWVVYHWATRLIRANSQNRRALSLTESATRFCRLDVNGELVPHL